MFTFSLICISFPMKSVDCQNEANRYSLQVKSRCYECDFAFNCYASNSNTLQYFFQKINTILDDEMKYDFKSVRALFVIIVSSGDQSGIYGTIGEKIQYDEITTKFEKVPGLMEKPKIFILDNYDIGKLK